MKKDLLMKLTVFFVMLAVIYPEFVRFIDLDNNRFALDCFKSAWDGAALIVSNEPV
jgi:hypothetical protein